LDFAFFFPVVFLILIGLFVILTAVFSIAKNQTQTKKSERYHSRRQVYMPGEFSEQLELDLRLPYKRFRQIYPNNILTYREYKKLQMQRSFKRSMSSQDNKRMVS